MMNVIYVENCDKLSYSQGFIHFTDENKDKIISVEDVSVILINTLMTSITVKTLIELEAEDITVIICDQKHFPTLSVVNLFRYHQLTLRLKEQVNWNESLKETYALHLIKNKIMNQIQTLYNHQLCTEALTNIYNRLDQESLLSLEGIASRVYFKSLFGKQFKRFSNDLINSALNYGYALVSAMIAQAIVAKGLHPSIGVFHHSQFNNFNLVYDLIEVYRPLIDAMVFEGLKTYETFNKDFKLYLLKVTYKNIYVDKTKCAFKQSINHLTDQTIKFLSNQETEYKGIAYG